MEVKTHWPQYVMISLSLKGGHCNERPWLLHIVPSMCLMQECVLRIKVHVVLFWRPHCIRKESNTQEQISCLKKKKIQLCLQISQHDFCVSNGEPFLSLSKGEGNDNPLQYSCLENPHGQRSLVGYSPWGRERVRPDRGTKQQQWRTGGNLPFICWHKVSVGLEVQVHSLYTEGRW